MLGGKSPSLVVPAALPLNRMRRPFSPDVTIFSRNPHGHSRQARGQGSYLSSRADAAGVVPEIERLDVFIPRRGRILYASMMTFKASVRGAAEKVS
jgi:hypothetical protein